MDVVIEIPTCGLGQGSTHPKVEDVQIEENSDETELYTGDDVHYISWVFGIILTCLYVGLLTLIPMHNPIVEPEYFWEFMLFAAFGWASIFTGCGVLQTHYWANMHPGNDWRDMFVMTLIISAVNICLTLIYYYLWTGILGYTAPMVFTYYIPGSLCGVVLCVLSWFR